MKVSVNVAFLGYLLAQTWSSPQEYHLCFRTLVIFWPDLAQSTRATLKHSSIHCRDLTLDYLGDYLAWICLRLNESLFLCFLEVSMSGIVDLVIVKHIELCKHDSMSPITKLGTRLTTLLGHWGWTTGRQNNLPFQSTRSSPKSLETVTADESSSEIILGSGSRTSDRFAFETVERYLPVCSNWCSSHCVIEETGENFDTFSLKPNAPSPCW